MHIVGWKYKKEVARSHIRSNWKIIDNLPSVVCITSKMPQCFMGAPHFLVPHVCRPVM